MSIQFGPSAGLPAGFAQWQSGSVLLRGHSPSLAANWFGPAQGTLGTNRFDPPRARTSSDAGGCYLAEGLIGLMHERVFRGALLPQVSRANLSAHHAVTEATLTRDVVLIDLVVAIAVHGLQLSDITAPPLLAPHAPLRYPATQGMAGAWAAINASAGFAGAPGGQVDGILYVSRFGPSERCVMLWDLASSALRWGSAQPLGSHPGLSAACGALGVREVP